MKMCAVTRLYLPVFKSAIRSTTEKQSGLTFQSGVTVEPEIDRLSAVVFTVTSHPICALGESETT
jgi:hypothetical protein